VEKPDGFAQGWAPRNRALEAIGTLATLICILLAVMLSISVWHFGSLARLILESIHHQPISEHVASLEPLPPALDAHAPEEALGAAAADVPTPKAPEEVETPPARSPVDPVLPAPPGTAGTPERIAAQPPPTAAPIQCSDIFVYIVSIVEADPASSAASLGIGQDGPARFRRPGDSIGEWRVVDIKDDWSGANPDVWLTKDDVLCRAELAGNSSRADALPALSAPTETVEKEKKGKRKRKGRKKAR